MAKRIAILVEKMYEDLEAWYPYLRLREAGHEPIFVGSEKGIEYKGKYGYPVKAEFGINGVRAEDFDAVVIPGGFAPDYMRRVPQMVAFVREMWNAEKIVAAICHGVWLPASADIVRGKHATSFFAIKDDIVNAGGIWKDSEVVRDGNLITSRRPEDLPAFTKTLLETLSE